MSFLKDLGASLLSSVNQSLGVSENTPGSLDLPGLNGNFGALGSFSNKIDKSAQRQYLETGTVRNIRPRNLEIIMQEPDITVLVKKKMFCSLSENFRYDLMNDEEKLFIKASKRLFYNKCRIIAAYERLSKIERITKNNGPINDYILPAIFSSLDVINGFNPNLIDAKTQATFDTIRKVKTFSDSNDVTTWLINSNVPYASDTGDGTGVFELTLVHSASWTVSTVLGGGSANLDIEDPYKLMIISNEDIERAISDAAGFFSSNNFFKLTQIDSEQVIIDLKKKLNDLRNKRNVPPIVFFINENSLLFKKVRAVIDEQGIEIIFNYNGGLAGINSTTEIDASFLTSSDNEIGLNANEEKLFKQIIQNTFSLLGLQETTKNQIIQYNKKTNSIRRKMKMFFGGHSIIQPMDTIHIYVGSKTQTDDKISQGLVNNFGGTLTNLNNLASNFTDNNKNYSTIEKDSIVGPEFPMWLWTLMRNDFTRQNAGQHVFAGIVNDAPHSNDNGKYTLKISINDNSHYLQCGQININPSVEVFNSDLYDPLTPFKLNFNASSGFINGEFPDLLDENIRLLNSESIRAKTGRFRGRAINENSYKVQDGEQIASKLFRKKLNDPDGLVYRWKEGIGSLTLFGEPHASGTFKNEISPSLTSDPFSGQDVMNVLSLLVTGQPYNFNNFLRAALTSGNLNRDELLNESNTNSFFRGLVNDLNKQNQTWGNFIPFKKLVINESGYSFLKTGEFDITNSNRQISSLLRDRAKRFDELSSLVPAFANNPQFYKIGIDGKATVVDTGFTDLSSLTNLASDIIKLDLQINQQQESFNKSLQTANIRSNDGILKIFGDDISFDPTFTGNNSVSENQRVADRQQFRKKLNELTQRRIWKVKANEDQNLFIVDDAYDKNYDIQAFEKSLSNGLQLFKSTYTNVFDKVNGVSQLLGLEIFADTQGHIQVRPPQYNRIPSSVFYRMIHERNQKGIQIFPDYLESLFFNQIQGLTQQLEIIEDEIRIRAAVLGATTDDSAKKLLNGSNVGGVNGELGFNFVTSEDGTFGSKDIRLLLIQASPDINTDSTSRALDSLNNSILGANNSTINFDIVKRATIINSNDQSNTPEQQIQDIISIIGQRLEIKKGSPAPTLKSLLGDDRSSTSIRGQLDTLNLTEQIAQFISERQSQIKLLANAIKNLNQGIAINRDPKVATNALWPSLNSTPSTLPEIIEHMIEDENNNDYGPNSGKRFILTDSKIISLSISEHAPDWTVVEVDGQIENGLVQNPSSLAIGEGGNAIASAFAVDYDMWRQYGFRAPHTVNIPFFSDADSQCAPYAVYLLNRARKEIFQGTVTIVGDETVQPGEVYYIEDRDLLFYAESISSSFSFGGQFTTTLNLKYGHNPGEYIPTMLDIIGKGLYSNRNQANLIKHIRHGNASGDTHITTLVADSVTKQSTTQAASAIVTGSYGEQNRKSLANLLLAVSGVLSPSLDVNTIKIEIRIYYNSLKNISVDNDLKRVAEGIKSWIVSPNRESVTTDGNIIYPDDKAKNTVKAD